MEKYRTIITMAITGALCFMVWFNSCNRPVVDKVTTRDTVWIKSSDQAHNVTPQDPPKPFVIHNHYEKEAPPQTDTAAIRAIIKEFFSERTYIDTIRNDSVEIYLREKVFKNVLTRPYVGYKWKAPERIIKETTTETIYANDFYLGVSSAFDRTMMNELSAEVLFETKNFAFGGGAGYDFGIQKPVVKVTVYRKIKWKPFKKP
jgi:hypothetical protein